MSDSLALKIEFTPVEIRAGMKAVFGIFTNWQLTDAEARTLLGWPAEDQYTRWKAGQVDSVPYDTMWRIGDLLGIYRSLASLFDEPSRRWAWVKRPNQDYGGRSALAYMLTGAPRAISLVRSRLEGYAGSLNAPGSGNDFFDAPGVDLGERNQPPK